MPFPLALDTCPCGNPRHHLELHDSIRSWFLNDALEGKEDKVRTQEDFDAITILEPKKKTNNNNNNKTKQKTKALYQCYEFPSLREWHVFWHDTDILSWCFVLLSLPELLFALIFLSLLYV